MTDREPPGPDLRDILNQHSSTLDCLELCPICRAADVLRATASPELREGWQDVQREALLTMKAVIDRYVERLDTEPDEHRQGVQDIRID